MRILIWLGLALLVILALRKKVRTGLTPPNGTNRAAPGSTGDNHTNHANRTNRANLGPGESMVCCAYCAIYVPLSESVHHAGKSYCCSAHARQSA